MKHSFWSKTISFIVTFAIIFNSLATPYSVLAQEITPTDTPTPVDTIAPTDSPTVEPTSTPIETATPDAIVAPTDSPTSTPSPVVVETGNLTTTVIENVDFSGVIGLNTNVDTGVLTTDQADYSPTSVAIITGTGFSANKTYTLVISSTDEPPTTTNIEVTTDISGGFTYSYQLDGNYRPNYEVEIKSGEVVVATVTFTDSVKILTINFAGTGGGSVAISDTTHPSKNTACGANCSISLDKDDVGTITATQDSTSSFTEWSLQSSGITGCSGNSCNFDMHNAQSVTVNFAINTYTLTYAAGSHGSISGTSPQTVNYSASGTAVTAVPDTGYHFTNWSDGVLTASRTDTNVTGNISATANFADTTGPSAAGSPNTTTPTNDSTPTWTWTSSTDNVGVDHYIIYWDTTPGGTSHWSSVASNTFTHSTSLADGTWYTFVQAYDAAGNASGLSTNGSVLIDTTDPIISVLGDDPITVEINSTYTDPGSTAIDGIDGDISDQIVVNDASVNTSLVGTYTVYFDVQDTSGNSADQKTRTVNVVDTIANTFTAISNDLYDNYSINNNLDQVNTNNVNNFSGLYLEKQDENGAPFGRITFNNPLDLTDTITQSFLQGLGSYLDMSQGRIALDARDSEMLATTGATLEVYYMPEVTESNLVVRDDLGNVLDRAYVVSNFNYDSDSETATFDAAHFTQFDFDTTAPDMSSLDPTIDPLNNSYTRGDATVSAHVTDDGAGVDSVNFTIKDNGENSASCSGVKDTEDSTLWSCQIDTTTLPDSNEGVYDMVIVATDAAGNSSSEEHYSTLKSYFDIDNTAPTTPVATPEGGDYTSDQSISLSSSDERSGLDKIFYTTDGSTPDNTKTEYTGSITVDKDMTIKAIAYDNAGNASSIMTETYGIAPVISSETSGSVTDTSVTVTWTTDDISTSRVIYDTVSHLILGSTPNYGYAFSTVEDPTKVTSHSVGLTALTPGTIYYYRTISHGSPETVSTEQTFTTTATPNPDVCANIDGSQTEVPDGMHLDASGKNCVNFGGSGPAPRNDQGIGGQVLGASTIAKPGTWPVLAYVNSGTTGEDKVLGTSTDSSASQSADLTATPDKFNLINWIMGHKKISLGILGLIALIIYMLIMALDKRKNK